MAAHLPVESSWRMVDGANDSFDTSIVPTSFSQESDAAGNENSNSFASTGCAPSSSQPSFYSPPSLRETHTVGSRLASGTSSQDDQVSLGGSDSVVSGSGSGSGTGTGTGSAGASQEDDIHSFLRKAETDKNVLLRSPFQPSVPSSVRQSPLSVASSVHNRRADRDAYHTPEPELRMPVIGANGSLDPAEIGEARGTVASSRASTLAAAVLRRRGGFFGAGHTGSPSQKRTAPGGSLLDQTRSAQKQDSRGTSVPANSSARRLVLICTVGLAAAYGAAAFTAGSATLGAVSTSRLYSTAASTLCSVPGASDRLAACSSDAGHSTHVSALLRPGEAAVDDDDPDEPVSLVRSVGDLMRAQVQLATIVRTRIISSRQRNAAPVGPSVPGSTVVPSFHDSWSVPRKRTKDLLAAARAQQKDASTGQDAEKSASDFLREIEAYLGATQRVSMALSVQEGGASTVAADALVYNTGRFAAQLRHMNDDTIKARGSVSTEASGESDPGWLSRLLLLSSSSKNHTSAKRRQAMLADAYRHHTKTLLAKTTDRVAAAQAALAELEVASKHLRAVQQYVDARTRDGNADADADANTIGSAPADSNTTTGSFSWLWRLLGLSNASQETNTGNQWAGYAEQLDMLRRDHDAISSRVADALDELAEVRDNLARLRARLSATGSSDAKAGSAVFSSDDLDLDMQLHIDVVEAGLQDLKRMASFSR